MSTTVRSTVNLACPKCGEDARLKLVIQAWVDLTAEGTDPSGDHEWDADSACMRPACGHTGTVATFDAKEATPGPQLKLYNVHFTQIDTFDGHVHALDQTHAEALARDLLDKGTDVFEQVGSYREPFDVTEVQS